MSVSSQTMPSRSAIVPGTGGSNCASGSDMRRSLVVTVLFDLSVFMHRFISRPRAYGQFVFFPLNGESRRLLYVSRREYRNRIPNLGEITNRPPVSIRKAIVWALELTASCADCKLCPCAGRLREMPT